MTNPRAPFVLIVSLAAVVAFGASAAAEQTGGLTGRRSVSVSVRDSVSGHSLAGTGTWTGGIWLPGDCDNTCFPGRVYGLTGRWSGSDFPGTVTYPGGSYRVGGFSDDYGYASVAFEGTWTAPPYTGEPVVTVQAPFAFAASATAPWSQPDSPAPSFGGTGLATLTLNWSPYTGGGWVLQEANYQIYDRDPRVTIATQVTSSAVAIDVAAADGSRVEVMVDGTLLGSRNTAPYRFTWDTSRVSDTDTYWPTTHYVAARAYGPDGQPGAWTVRTVEIQATGDHLAPAVSFTAPAEGARLHGFTTIEVIASDEGGVSSIELLVDGVAVGNAVYFLRVDWDTWTVANGPHTLTARAVDKAGNIRTTEIAVVVENPGPAESDFTGDGKMDLLWQNISDGYLATWSLDGTSMTSSDLLSPNRVSDTNWRIVGTGDFNRDGKPDIVWQEQTQGWIGIWLMNGTTLLQSTTLAPAARQRVADTNWKIAGVADIDNDGDPDIVWQERTQGWLVAWILHGLQVTGSYALTPERVGDTNWKIVANGDFNRDGKTDLVWQDMSTGHLAAWFMDGLNLLDSVLLSPNRVSDTTWTIVAAGDVDRDGKTDLVWQDQARGWLAIWLMNGTTLKQSVGFTPERVSDTNWKIVGPR